MPSGNERPSGLRAFFRKHKRSSASPPDNATSQKPAEKVDAKEERRAYVPRYARRDMFLAVPVEERPDLVAKANEARLRNVCSEIGFNTTPSSSSASLRSSAGRIKNLHSQASQPSLRRTQENAPGRTFDAGPSRETVAGSSRAPLHEPSMSMPAVELPGSKNTTETYWRGMASTYHRLASRPSQSALVGPASLDDRAEGLNRAFPRMQSINTEGASYGPATFVTRPTDTASSTCRTQRGYFGHGVALPNLRASEVMPKGKGKAPIYDVGRHCDETTPTPTGASHDVRESVVIRMQGGRMPPHLSAPPAPRESSDYLFPDPADQRL